MENDGIILSHTMVRKPFNIVSVIVSFDTEGKVRPLYVRIGEDACKVISSRLKTDKFAMILEYDCMIQDGENARHMNLYYYNHQKVWSI